MNQIWCLFFLLYLIAAVNQARLVWDRRVLWTLKATQGLPLDTWKSLQMLIPSHRHTHTHTHELSPAKLDIEDDGDVMHYSCNQSPNLNKLRTSLVVQRLKLSAPHAGGPGSIPDKGIRYNSAYAAAKTWHSQISKYFSKKTSRFIYISVQLLSCSPLFATPWTAACQASLSITNSWVYSNSCE